MEPNIFIIKKGDNPPWSSESYYIGTNTSGAQWIYGYEEICYSDNFPCITGSNFAVTRPNAVPYPPPWYRDFRYPSNAPIRGVQALPITFTANTQPWPINYTEKWGTNSCGPTQNVDDASQSQASVNIAPALPAYLQDRRSISTNTSAWYDVNVIMLEEIWQGDVGPIKEDYYYGRWTDPQGSSWGLGLVKWQMFQWIQGQGWVPIGIPQEYKYLVDCTPTPPPCMTCPDVAFSAPQRRGR
ncbi:MAG: hypothetical protein HY232_04540 [Acidobacteria bacterium]|nr:hypothetical protein [Acidobacteriota bacterium]